MNKQEAHEIARKAELKRILNDIEEVAKCGEYHRQLKILDREVIYELNKLGFNCGLVNKKTNSWHIDWSK